MNFPERTAWIRALTALPAEEIKTLVAGFDSAWQIRHRALPQAGLGLLKLRDGAFDEAFYLGEFPLASAYVVVSLPDGRKAEGAAQVMDDDLELAEALAVCDAVLANRLPGWEAVRARVERGMAQRAEEERIRKAMLTKTRVDFSLLESTEAEDE